MSESTHRRTRARPLPLVLCSGTLTLFALGVQAETIRIVPSVAVSESYTDNIALTPAEGAKSGWITDITPGLRVDLTGARARGYLDFRVHDLSYSSQSSLDNQQKTLYSRLTVEAVEKWLFIDGRADITQQNRSAFGPASTPDRPTQSANRVETSTLQVAPYVRGGISDVARYLVRYNAAQVSTDEPGIPSTRTGEFSARLQSARPSAMIGWALEASDLAIRNDRDGLQRDSRVRATIIYAVVPSFHLSLSGGYENSDFGVEQEDGLRTPGGGFTWTPSERTQFAALAERRYFGTGHNVLFTHRTPRGALRVASIKDAAVLPAGIAAGSTGSITGLMDFVLTSAIPNPDERAARVRQRIEQSGIAESSLLSSGVVTSSPYVFRNSEATGTFLGARDTITFGYVVREERYSAAGGSAVVPAAADTRQRGFNFNWARQLTPLTSANFVARNLRTEGLGAAAPETRQKEFAVVLATQLGEKTTASLGLRSVDFHSSLDRASYRENAIFATISLRP